MRRQVEAEHAVFVTGRDAVSRFEIGVAAPPSRVWTAFLGEEGFRAWSGAKDVLVYPALAGPVGTSYRCILSDGYEFGQLLIAMDSQGRRLTLRRADVPIVGYVYTTYAVHEQDGSSVVNCDLGVARRLPFSSKLISGLERKHPESGPTAALERIKRYSEQA